MMDATGLGKWLALAGLILAAIGLAIWAAGKHLGIPLGRLPGDIRVKGEGWSFYFPIVTCLVVSIALTALLTLIGWIMRK